MLVYIQQKDIQQSRTKINKFLSITTKINKTQSSEPKIKKCKIQTCNMNHFKFLSIIITTKINKKQSQKLKKRKIRNMNHFEYSTYFHHSTTHKCHFHNLCIFPADVFKDRNHRVAFASCLYF